MVDRKILSSDFISYKVKLKRTSVAIFVFNIISNIYIKLILLGIFVSKYDLTKSTIVPIIYIYIYIYKPTNFLDIEILTLGRKRDKIDSPNLAYKNHGDHMKT